MTDAALRSLVIEREIAHPPAKIWRALTESALVEEWLMKNDLAPVAGRRFNFRAPPMPYWNGVLDCEVLAVEAPTRLSYSWNSSGAEAANGLKTVVTWTLTPTAKGTLLRLEHAGFRPDQEANYQGARHGWAKNLEGLERVAAGLG
ncbi:MAG: SRPBCC family protein [Candidatus Eiseniibacteriota bacterium]